MYINVMHDVNSYMYTQIMTLLEEDFFTRQEIDMLIPHYQQLL